jgi:cell division protein ZipA
MEAEGLRWSLLIIGSLVIVGLAVHGIWLSRKNNENKENTHNPKKDQEYQPSGWQSDTDGFDEIANDANDPIDDNLDIKFDIGIDEVAENAKTDLDNDKSTTNVYDDLGVGAVRVVSSEPKVDVVEEQKISVDIKVEPEITSSKIYASVVTQPKPEYAEKQSSLATEDAAISQQQRTSNKAQKMVSQPLSAASNHAFSSYDNYQAPEPPPFLLKKKTSEPEMTGNSSVLGEEPPETNPPEVVDRKQAEENLGANMAERLNLSEQACNLVKRKNAELVRKRREPKIAEDQMRIDFDDQSIAKPAPKDELKAKPATQEQAQEVLVLNVKSADDNPILGSALLPMLLTLGFKFGDQDIFHRHVNSNGKGPVLFSLANMFKPGNFDIDNLENFTTGGISLFMILPIEGEPHQVFNMMHNAARKISGEFSAQIYDGRRTLLTKQSLQQYVEKIREFERQRLLRG